MEESQPSRLILSQQFKIILTSSEFGHVRKILMFLNLIFPPFTHIILSKLNMIVIREIVIGNNIGTKFCSNLSKCKAGLSFLKVKETFWEIHFQSQKLNEPKVNFCLSDGVARSKLVKTNFSNELLFFFWKIQILLKICDLPLYLGSAHLIAFAFVEVWDMEIIGIYD